MCNNGTEEQDQDVIDALSEAIADTVEEEDVTTMMELIETLLEDGK